MFDRLIPLADEKTVQERLAICRACEFLGELPVIHTEVCKACGCPVVNKTKLQHVSCPKGKW